MMSGFRWQSEYPWYVIVVKSKKFPVVFKLIIKNHKKKMTEKYENFHSKPVFFLNSATFHQLKVSFFEFPNSFQKRREKPKKNDGKTGIFTQNQFSTKSIFLYGCNSKTNHCKYLKFSPNVNVSVIYIMSIKNCWMTKKL
ncbi:Uncharacterized protein FWK35_00035157 [Aphis craccivora]|uniref:Uncharacterized protein n=1 Tax=Aphis craccivora TaxID=307492 RepID=A0A6G0Y9W6_APHCR|nr:Uncharacterized protein FWK35_00035157 [Aphis craccivora]